MRFTVFIFLFFSCLRFQGQESSAFQFIKPNQKNVKLKFELYNNLIIIPVELNGVSLNFLLDTGIDKTLLIALGAKDSLDLEIKKKVSIVGLGKEDEFEAFKSINNTLKIGGVTNLDQTIYFVLDENNELSTRIGLPVNGFIGYDFFKDFVVKINYKRKEITLYNPNQFNKKLRWYNKLPMQFYKNKPYVTAKAKDSTIANPLVNLMLDLGSSSGFWLFESDKINVPELHFEDVIGYGFSSLIRGKRSRIEKISLGKYDFDEPKIAYPDLTKFAKAESFEQRDGSLGAEILRRFTLFLDYQSKQFYFRANSSLNDPYNYDMSGISVVNDGVKLIEEVIFVNLNSSPKQQEDGSKNVINRLMVNMKVTNKIIVDNVRDPSPASEVGILPGDEIIKINGKYAGELQLDKISSLLAEKEGKQVKIELLRGDKTLKIKFKLRDRLKDLVKD